MAARKLADLANHAVGIDYRLVQPDPVAGTTIDDDTLIVGAPQFGTNDSRHLDRDISPRLAGGEQHEETVFLDLQGIVFLHLRQQALVFEFQRRDPFSQFLVWPVLLEKSADSNRRGQNQVKGCVDIGQQATGPIEIARTVVQYHQRDGDDRHKNESID